MYSVSVFYYFAVSLYHTIDGYDEAGQSAGSEEPTRDGKRGIGLVQGLPPVHPVSP